MNEYEPTTETRPASVLSTWLCTQGIPVASDAVLGIGGGSSTLASMPEDTTDTDIDPVEKYNQGPYISYTFLEDMGTEERSVVSDTVGVSGGGGSEVLSESEILERRGDRIRRLMRLYQGQGRRLRDILANKQHRSAHRNVRNDCSEGAAAVDGSGLASGSGFISLLRARKRSAPLMHHPDVKEAITQNLTPTSDPDADLPCVLGTCCNARLRPTKFCFAHVLRDPDQKLFQPCCARVGIHKSSCGFPVIRSMEPPLCTAHTEVRRKRLRPSISESDGRDASGDLDGDIGIGASVGGDGDGSGDGVGENKVPRGVSAVVDRVRSIQIKRQRLLTEATDSTDHADDRHAITEE
eukprot:TRINITY_DN8793_c0_g1_i1.p1 TRINITY_DN8793_c0_g1~~TRINITY_DN8793_c0_g1_i1.p1  ORF type:complete len:352 (+),score=53.33 TRINITY_DN8793_c0_g1_i1:187-1242(+)